MTIEDYFSTELYGAGFLEWGKEIDRLSQNETGISILDWPDQNYAEMFEEELTAAEAWAEIRAELGFA